MSATRTAPPPPIRNQVGPWLFWGTVSQPVGDTFVDGVGIRHRIIEAVPYEGGYLLTTEAAA